MIKSMSLTSLLIMGLSSLAFAKTSFVHGTVKYKCSGNEDHHNFIVTDSSYLKGESIWVQSVYRYKLNGRNKVSYQASPLQDVEKVTPLAHCAEPLYIKVKDLNQDKVVSIKACGIRTEKKREVFINYYSSQIPLQGQLRGETYDTDGNLKNSCELVEFKRKL